MYGLSHCLFAVESRYEDVTEAMTLPGAAMCSAHSDWICAEALGI